MAVGDIMMSINRGTGRMIKQNGPHYLFEKIQPFLGQADLLFGNLESPIADDGVSYTNRKANITFRAEAESGEGLKRAGFSVLSAANNHITDYGEQGLRRTVEVLRGVGIEFTGLYAPSTHPGYSVIEQKGVKVAFLAYNAPALPRAHPKSVHSWRVKKFSSGNARRDLEHLRRSVKPDIIIVSCHWGKDYKAYPVPFQMEIARQMIDQGAHIVLGHGPHVIQGTEEYKHGVIVYSLGDFIFDEPYPETQESFIFSCTLSPDGVRDTKCVPVIRNDDFQPLLAEGERKQNILDKIAHLSGEYKRADWIKDPRFDPTERFFIKCIKRGRTYRNFSDAMSVFPARFWIERGLPILLSKSWSKGLRRSRSDAR